HTGQPRTARVIARLFSNHPEVAPLHARESPLSLPISYHQFITNIQPLRIKIKCTGRPLAPNTLHIRDGRPQGPHPHVHILSRSSLPAGASSINACNNCPNNVL